IYDRNIIFDHETITLKTRRGLSLVGSNNHRVLLSDGQTWKRLDELKPGDQIAISGGGDRWPEEQQRMHWIEPYRGTLADAAARADVSLDTMVRYRQGQRVKPSTALAIEAALVEHDREDNLAVPNNVNKRPPLRVPVMVDDKVGAFLGYLVGD